MEKLILFMVSSVGATLIVTLSSIFEPVRNLFSIKDEQRATNIQEGREKGTLKERTSLFFKDLTSCPMCFGFWMGGVMYFIVGYEINCLHELGTWFAMCCSTSVLSILAYSKLK